MKRKTRKKREPEPLSIEEQFPAIALVARVRAHHAEGDSNELSQDELRAEFSVSDQTVRNWTRRGLPWRSGPAGKPRYPAFEARCWVECWRALEELRKHDQEAVGWLTPGQAINWYVRRSLETEDHKEEHGPAFVIVPLDWDHPYRERLLRLAARGSMPPCDDPTWLSGEMYTEAFDAVAAEWDAPLPRLVPSPPLPVAPELLDSSNTYQSRPKYFRPRDNMK